MEVHHRHHHGTFRLLIGIIALIVIGIAAYLLLEYTAVQGNNGHAVAYERH